MLFEPSLLNFTINRSEIAIQVSMRMAWSDTRLDNNLTCSGKVDLSVIDEESSEKHTFYNICLDILYV